MEKTLLTQFIEKYSLGGTVEAISATFSDEGRTLETRFISDASEILGKVKLTGITASSITEETVHIFKTQLLKKVLGVLDNDVSLSLISESGKNIALALTDNSIDANVMLADAATIKPCPALKKMPDFTLKFAPDSEFVSKFIRSSDALKDVTDGSFTIETPSEGVCKISIGQTNKNSNRITLTINCEGSLSTKPKFSTDLFKSVLLANKDYVGATISVSDGMVLATFNTPEFESEYYLPAQKKVSDVED